MSGNATCQALFARGPPIGGRGRAETLSLKGDATMIHAWIVLGSHLIVLLRSLIVL
jgi:hypothetical protein